MELEAKRLEKELQGKWQLKLLTKTIEQCELANALKHTPESLSVRDTKLSANKLMESDYVLPWSLRVQITRKVLKGHLGDFAKATDDSDMNLSLESIMSCIACWKHACSDDTDMEASTWQPDTASFDILCAELENQEVEELAEIKEEDKDQAHVGLSEVTWK